MAPNALQDFLDAEENHGFGVGGDLLPKGVYPVEIVDVQRPEVTSKGTSVGMRLGLAVTDGPFTGRRAYVNHFLADIYDPEARGKTFYNMSSTFIRSIGVKLTPADPSRFPSTAHATLATYDPASWIGARFIAEIGVETAEAQVKSAEKQDRAPSGMEQDRNRLAGWHTLNSKERGFEYWQAKELPKQIRAIERQRSGASTSGNGSMPSAATL